MEETSNVADSSFRTFSMRSGSRLCGGQGRTPEPHFYASGTCPYHGTPTRPLYRRVRQDGFMALWGSQQIRRLPSMQN
ncbi:hypothetical protein TNCV_4358731 [Trichonephila clavipes]|nr:hypothetical protein TNCV_4358731 [Trichonephila clavipes]